MIDRPASRPPRPPESQNPGTVDDSGFTFGQSIVGIILLLIFIYLITSFVSPYLRGNQ